MIEQQTVNDILLFDSFLSKNSDLTHNIQFFSHILMRKVLFLYI